MAEIARQDERRMFRALKEKEAAENAAELRKKEAHAKQVADMLQALTVQVAEKEKKEKERMEKEAREVEARREDVRIFMEAEAAKRMAIRKRRAALDLELVEQMRSQVPVHPNHRMGDLAKELECLHLYNAPLLRAIRKDETFMRGD